MLPTLLFTLIINAITPNSVECRQNAAKVRMGSAQAVFRSVRAHSFQHLDHLALLRAYNVHLCSNIMPRFIWLQYTEFQMYYASV